MSAEIKLNLSDYKSSGVYFLEMDNSISETTTTNTNRLAVGFNDEGPFNRPVYISSQSDCDELLGDINRKLERKGCFSNRNVRNMVTTSPLYVLNLLDVNTVDSSTNTDKVGINAISFDIKSKNIADRALFSDLYDRSRFWVADETALTNAITKSGKISAPDKVHAPLFGLGNCSTKDISLIVRKAEGLTGYSVTFLDWYGTKDNIPYNWINPYDYVSDYFVQVIAIKGNWQQSQYSIYAADSVWGEFFNENGLKKEKLNKFLRLDSVTVIGNWTGCIIPDFYDKTGANKSIQYQINKLANKTGLLFSSNDEALDSLTMGQMSDSYPLNDNSTKLGWYLDVDGSGDQTWGNDETTNESAKYIIDMIGHTIDCSTNYNDISFLSYNISGNTLSNNIYRIAGKWNSKYPKQFSINSADLVDGGDGDTDLELAIGDFVKNENGILSKITKKQYSIDASSNGIFTFISVEKPIIFTSNLENYQVLNSPDLEDSNLSENSDMYQNFQVIMGMGDETSGIVEEDGSITKTGFIEIHRQITSIYDTLSFIPLNGLKITNRHLPGYDSMGAPNLEAGVEKIYSMLEDDGIKRGLLNPEMVDFRYIIDTMAYGLGEECKSKKYLTALAQSRGHCTALCNLPSISQFANSDIPFFGDTYEAGKESKPTFNTKYIPMGGNTDILYPSTSNAELFTLPSESNGSKFAGFFAPFLKYKDGTKTILVPPAADVSNIFVNKFLGGDPYKTPANTNGILSNSNIVGVEYSFDQTDRDSLEPFGVNPIITRGGQYMIYGDRTAYQTVDSDFNYLHVRELLNTIEIKIKEILDDYPFQYNLAVTRAEISSRITPILQAMQDSKALVKYDIQIDSTNNTEEIIQANFCIVDIGVWITRNTEKILTRITVNKSASLSV